MLHSLLFMDCSWDSADLYTNRYCVDVWMTLWGLLWFHVLLSDSMKRLDFDHLTLLLKFVLACEYVSGWLLFLFFFFNYI